MDRDRFRKLSVVLSRRRTGRLWLLAGAALACFFAEGRALAQGPPSTFENSLGMKLIWIAPGSFSMGAQETEASRPDEKRHEVTLSRGYYLAAHEVTVEQFRQFADATGYTTDAERGGQTFEQGKTGGFMITSDAVSRWIPGVSWHQTPWPQDGKHPAVFLSWNDAQEFVRWLAGKEGRKYRLPTEAEWEYACRAGTTTAYWWGDSLDDTGARANVGDWAFRKHFPALQNMMEMDDHAAFTAPVGSYQANPFGLYDMIGNAWEWVQDYYAPYAEEPAVDPKGAQTAADRIARGGGYATTHDRVRCAARFRDLPENRFSGTGFRVALDAE